MKTTITPLERYQEEDHKQRLHIITIGHFFMGLLLLSPDVNAWATNYHAQVCLLTTVFFLLVFHYYDWKNHTTNLTLIIAYATLLIGEYCLAGVPGTQFMSSSYSGVGPPGKGAITELFLFTLPAIYVVLRVALLIPIILMTRWENRY